MGGRPDSLNVVLGGDGTAIVVVEVVDNDVVDVDGELESMVVVAGADVVVVGAEVVVVGREVVRADDVEVLGVELVDVGAEVDVLADVVATVVGEDVVDVDSVEDEVLVLGAFDAIVVVEVDGAVVGDDVVVLDVWLNVVCLLVKMCMLTCAGVCSTAKTMTIISDACRTPLSYSSLPKFIANRYAGKE